MDQNLVDEIYECSFAPELWPSVLDRLARISDAVGGTFFVASSTKVQIWTASEPLVNDPLPALVKTVGIYAGFSMPRGK